MGVTGTLESLGQNQKEIVENVYHLNNNTYMPSVYGKNQLTFAK